MSDEYAKYIDSNVVAKSGKKYQITKYVAEGGNGYVFECIDDAENVLILKLLHTRTSEKKQNFEKEIEIQEKLDCKYIVKCIDSGESTFGKQKASRPFYIMKKYDSNLELLINENRLSPSKAFKYILQICQGLKYLHSRKPPIIHRDLKPENILYDSKNDRVLICDLGLAHLNLGTKSINDSFVGNIDYHAPEQKRRGKCEVGTYTDIYSFGLIINALFTNEIAQGENYKKILECCPCYSFLDKIVERMLVHDVNRREKDIRNILAELEEHDMEYETRKEQFIVMYCKKGLPVVKIDDFIDINSLIKYSLNNYMNWSKINLNYFCDFHFTCKNILKDSVLINIIYNKIRAKFEYEGNTYEKNKLPYLPLNLDDEFNYDMYSKFTDKVDKLNVYEEFERLKNQIKKYFSSLCEDHAKEFWNEIDDIEKAVEDHLIDAPALMITGFILENMRYLRDNIECDIYFFKYEECDVENKDILYKDINVNYNNLLNFLSEKKLDFSSKIIDDELQLLFDIRNDEKFTNFMDGLISRCEDKRKDDLIDMLDKGEYIGIETTRYFLNDYISQVILELVCENYSAK